MNFLTIPALNFVMEELTFIAPLLSIAALVIGLVALFLWFSLRARLSRMLLGRSGSLEETLAVLSRDVKELQSFRKELESYLKQAEERLQSSIQGTSLIRFNPFSGDGSGGNQSFAAAFLNEHNDGVVISSLYARDRAVVYGKPVKKGASQFELTEEEKQAITKAKDAITQRQKTAA